MSAGRRGLLVDWGGVLTTSPYTSFAAFGVGEGLPVDALATALAPEGALRATFDALEAGAIDDRAFERACAEGLGLAPDRADGLRRRLFAGMRSDHAVRRLVWVARSQGVRTGLLSNSVGTGGYDARTIDELFDVDVISGDVGMRKPDPAIYRLAVERMALDPAELVFVDDLPENLPPAEALGVATVLHTDAAATAAALERLLGVRLDPIPFHRGRP